MRTDSRPRARWYQLRGLPLVGSECVCPQCNSSFVITRGSDKPSACAAAGTRVAAMAWTPQHHFVCTCFGLAAWRVWRYERGYSGHRTARRRATCCVRIEGLVQHFAAQRSGKHGAAPSRCARYPLAPPSPVTREFTRCRHPSA